MAAQLDGTDARPEAFRPGPETYDAELVPRIFRPWAKRLVAAADLMAGERVLDVACGSGIVARLAAAEVGPGGTVVGVDINPGMLEVARRQAQGSGGGIEFIEGNAEALPLPDSSVDAVFCQQGLQFVEDRPAAVRELGRVLTPRGRAVCVIWRGMEHHQAMQDLNPVLARHLSPDALEGSDAPFWLGDVDEVRKLFTDAAFGNIHLRNHVSEVRFPSARSMLDGLMGAHVPAATAIVELSEEAREAMYRDLEEAFRTYADDDGVMFTMTGLLVHARK